jgi:glycosyltransferase involved in cell wall biosynthesis
MEYVIGISTYRGANRIGWTLKSVERLTGLFSTIIVDDGSPLVDFSETASLIQTLKFPATLCRFPVNRGLSATCNEILRHSEGRSVILLDDDALLPPNFLRVLDCVFENKIAVAGFVGEKAIYGKAVEELGAGKDVPISGTDRPPEFTPELSGFCFAINGNLVPLADPKTRFDNIYKHYFYGMDFCCQQAAKKLPSFKFYWPRIPHLEHATLNAYEELKAEESVKHDFHMFNLKWKGNAPHEKAKEFVSKIEFGRLTFPTAMGMTRNATPIYEERSLCQPKT